MKWYKIEEKTPECSNDVLLYCENRTSGTDRIMTAHYKELGEKKFFRRMPIVLREKIVEKSPYPRFTDKWSFDDLDGDYCVITKWAYMSEAKQEAKEA